MPRMTPKVNQSKCFPKPNQVVLAPKLWPFVKHVLERSRRIHRGTQRGVTNCGIWRPWNEIRLANQASALVLMLKASWWQWFSRMKKIVDSYLRNSLYLMLFSSPEFNSEKETLNVCTWLAFKWCFSWDIHYSTLLKKEKLIYKDFQSPLELWTMAKYLLDMFTPQSDIFFHQLQSTPASLKVTGPGLYLYLA